MANVRCPHCGSPAMIWGNRWECGWCGDFGGISPFQPSERAKLMQVATPSVHFTITLTDISDEEGKSHAVFPDRAGGHGAPGDFDENEWAYRDLLIAAFPLATSRWSEEELAEMDTMDLFLQIGQHELGTALEMVKLLDSTAEEPLSP